MSPKRASLNGAKAPSQSRTSVGRKAQLGSLRSTVDSFKVPEKYLDAVASELFQSLNTAISLSCEILLRYGEYELLAKKTIDPLDYNSADSFRDDYLAVSFLRKTPFDIKNVNREEAAKKKFFEAEQQCVETNRRFQMYARGSSPKEFSPRVERMLSLASRKIATTLGDFDSREWLFGCRFGPGSFNHPDTRGMTSVYDKLQVRPSCTKDMAEIGAILVMSSPAWARSVTDSEDEGFWPIVKEEHLSIAHGNRVTFVPKTALTDRPIAIEPLLNVYAQLGIGAMMRRRLKKVGVNLDDQTRNQQLACKGSYTGELATVDLSSASDTVARWLVYHLLPEEWWTKLDLVRSKIGEIDGQRFTYAKFSSMGNGFTFELESLIFWALSYAACVESGLESFTLSVYGDDIIVPVDAYDNLFELLTACGFTLNANKSFKTGPFRESCGKDYYNGQDVRPFLQKEVPSNLSEVLKVANGLARLAHRRNHGFGRDRRLRSAWLASVRPIPDSLRRHLVVPAHAGDTDGLVEDWDFAQRSTFVRTERGWHGFWALRLAAIPVLRVKPSNFQGGLATLLYRCRDGFPDERSPPASPRQGRDFEWKLQPRAFYGPWTNLGPWER